MELNLVHFLNSEKNVIPLQQFPNMRQPFPFLTVILANKTKGFSLTFITIPPNFKISHYY